MPFGMVRGVGQGMGVLDGGGDRRRGRGSFGVNVGRPIVTNRAFTTRSSQTTLRTCCCWDYASAVLADLKSHRTLHVGLIGSHMLPFKNAFLRYF